MRSPRKKFRSPMYRSQPRTPGSQRFSIQVPGATMMWGEGEGLGWNSSVLSASHVDALKDFVWKGSRASYGLKKIRKHCAWLCHHKPSKLTVYPGFCLLPFPHGAEKPQRISGGWGHSKRGGECTSPCSVRGEMQTNFVALQNVCPLLITKICIRGTEN